MKARRLRVFLRGVRAGVDPVMALRRRRVLLGFSDEDESLTRDWFAVGEDLHMSAAKFAEASDEDGPV